MGPRTLTASSSFRFRNIQTKLWLRELYRLRSQMLMYQTYKDQICVQSTWSKLQSWIFQSQSQTPILGFYTRPCWQMMGSNAEVGLQERRGESGASWTSWWKSWTRAEFCFLVAIPSQEVLFQAFSNGAAKRRQDSKYLALLGDSVVKEVVFPQASPSSMLETASERRSNPLRKEKLVSKVLIHFNVGRPCWSLLRQLMAFMQNARRQRRRLQPDCTTSTTQTSTTPDIHHTRHPPHRV